MANRQSRGRQRIPLQLIKNQDNLYASFSKRRLGLYKKASELSVLCNIDIGIIIFSPTNKPYSFFSPSQESVLDRYMKPNTPLRDYARVVDSHTNGRIAKLSQILNEAHVHYDEVNQHGKDLNKRKATLVKSWWEETPIEEMNREQVTELGLFFEFISTQTNLRIKQLEYGVGPSNQGNIM